MTGISTGHLEAVDPDVFLSMIDICLQAIGTLPSVVYTLSIHRNAPLRPLVSACRTIKPIGLQLSNAKTGWSETQGC